MSREGEADAVVREAKECVGVTELLTLKVNNEWSITEAEDALKAQEIPAVGNAQGWGWKLISALKGWYRGVMEVRLCCAPTGLKGFLGLFSGRCPELVCSALSGQRCAVGSDQAGVNPWEPRAPARDWGLKSSCLARSGLGGLGPVAAWRLLADGCGEPSLPLTVVR